MKNQDPGQGVPGWSALDRASEALRLDNASPYSLLTDEELLESIARARAGLPETPETAEKVRRAVQTLYIPEYIQAMTDEQLLASLERDRQLMDAPRRRED